MLLSGAVCSMCGERSRGAETLEAKKPKGSKVVSIGRFVCGVFC